jgi:hypothetical protein
MNTDAHVNTAQERLTAAAGKFVSHWFGIPADHSLQLLILSYFIDLHDYIRWCFIPRLRAGARFDCVVYLDIQLSRVHFALSAVERSFHSRS